MKNYLINSGTLFLLAAGGLVAAPQQVITNGAVPAPVTAAAPATPVAKATAAAPIAAATPGSSGGSSPATVDPSDAARQAALAAAIAKNATTSLISLQIITQNNIFDPNRRPSDGGPRIRTAPISEVFSFRGCGVKDENGVTAFFSGSGIRGGSGMFHTNDVINGYKIVEITLHSVKLQAPNSTNVEVLAEQTGLHRSEGGPWTFAVVPETFNIPRPTIIAADTLPNFDQNISLGGTPAFGFGDNTDNTGFDTGNGNGRQNRRGGRGGGGGGRGGRGGNGGGGGGFGGGGGGGGFGGGGFGADTPAAAPAAPPDPSVLARLRAQRAAEGN